MYYLVALVFIVLSEEVVRFERKKVVNSHQTALVLFIFVHNIFLYFNQRRSGKSTNTTIDIIPTYSYAFDVVAVATANLITRRSESLVNQSNIVMASTFVGPVDVADPSTGKLRRFVLFA